MICQSPSQSENADSNIRLCPRSLYVLIAIDLRLFGCDLVLEFDKASFQLFLCSCRHTAELFVFLCLILQLLLQFGFDLLEIDSRTCLLLL